MELRDYQEKAVSQILSAWQHDATNIVYQLATGGGKTIVIADIIRREIGSSLAIAHRSELVSQMAMALAIAGIKHRIIGSLATIRFVNQEQVREFGHHFYDPTARVGVASVDTLRARGDAFNGFAAQVGLWVIDECHHVQRNNKWGAAVGMFPNARGLGVSATPFRADGKGIGSKALGGNGVFDTLIEGPGMAELTDAGYLAPYRIIAPPNDLDESALKRGATGDFTLPSMVKAAEKSHIVGDIVTHYRRYADGKRAIVFAINVEAAHAIAVEFKTAGIRAEAITGKTPDAVRAEFIRRFRANEISVLVNVDLFGEGFDVPGVEVVIMARPTHSFPLFAQQFGRPGRPFAGKTHGIIIDHVGNIAVPGGLGRHPLPDAPRVLSLANRERRAKNDDVKPVPVTACPQCFETYFASKRICPYCGHQAEPVMRSNPEFVDGDLMELDAATLAKMRGEANATVRPSASIESMMLEAGHSQIIARAAANRHAEKRDAQAALRDTMQHWAGLQDGDTSEKYRIFWYKFGMDVLSAQALKRVDAQALDVKIRKDMGL